jgi:hypothetical protein
MLTDRQLKSSAKVVSAFGRKVNALWDRYWSSDIANGF